MISSLQWKRLLFIRQAALVAVSGVSEWPLPFRVVHLLWCHCIFQKRDFMRSAMTFALLLVGSFFFIWLQLQFRQVDFDAISDKFVHVVVLERQFVAHFHVGLLFVVRALNSGVRIEHFNCGHARVPRLVLLKREHLLFHAFDFCKRHFIGAAFGEYLHCFLPRWKLLLSSVSPVAEKAHEKHFSLTVDDAPHPLIKVRQRELLHAARILSPCRYHRSERKHQRRRSHHWRARASRHGKQCRYY